MQAAIGSDPWLAGPHGRGREAAGLTKFYIVSLRWLLLPPNENVGERANADGVTMMQQRLPGSSLTMMQQRVESGEAAADDRQFKCVALGLGG